ncbi:endonuclease V [Candidatus Bathyarchaeota archaeon]|nr:MAG: endonuclease V [Candidatus Bathyarchaeota archaeon]
MNVKGGKLGFSVEKAHKAQLELSKRIILEDRLPEKIRLVAGVDVAYMKDLSIGAVAVLDYSSLKLIEARTALCKTRFPYIPTLLSFREIPPVVLSVKKLRVQPDIFLVDGQGFAHPYRCGFASHLGLVIGKPTVGVAKSWLFGELENAEVEKGVKLLKHHGEVVGAVVETKRGCKPVYVSVGHMVSLETAVKIVRQCSRYNRIPEPVLQAHKVANVEKRKLILS